MPRRENSLAALEPQALLPADKLYPFLSYALVILSLIPQTKNRS